MTELRNAPNFLSNGNVPETSNPMTKLSENSESLQTELHVAHSAGYVVGIDVGGTNLRAALSDMTGTILAKCSCSTSGIRDPHLVVALICDSIDKLLLQKQLTRDALCAVAVGVPGVTDVDRGIVIATSYLMGWRDVPLRELLEAALHVPVTIENDVNIAAVAEQHAGVALGADNFVFLAIGTGIGAGIVLNGQLHRGHGWTAGEIGYLLVPGTSPDPVERGAPGPLEAIVGGEGIKAQWKLRWIETRTTLAADANATQIFDHAQNSDTLAQEILQLSARTLAYAIYNISLVLNCPLFVLGGGVGIHPALVQATRDVLLQQNARVQPKLVISALGSEAQLIGAVFLAIEAAMAKA